MNISDMPDEVIINIWNKLERVSVLFSFVGINQRFHRLVRDRIYTRSIELIKPNCNYNNCSLSVSLLDQLCLYVLPHIHDLVESLTLESIAMQRVLSAGRYPCLRKLTLVNIEQEFVRRYLTSNKRKHPMV